MTSPSERRIKPGYENKTPRTPDDFAQCWKASPERQSLLRDIEGYKQTHPLGGPGHEQFATSRKLEKSTKQRTKSPYTLSYWKQIHLCMWREFQRLKGDPSVPIVMIIVNFFEALIIASIFYNLPQSTSSFFMRGGVLFMMVLLNAFGSMLEIMSLYAKREIVEKVQHRRSNLILSRLTLRPAQSLCPVPSKRRGHRVDDHGYVSIDSDFSMPGELMGL
jgi:ATP-binding cassette subfamily G (WHITE) protein 2 (PDR)